ncbi:MAG TPA: glycosyltransferase family 9 protein [Burkholderiales bacterium]|nr:glycosyltransferase family 9 protein [Burkholderiales bacterium]
MNETPRLLQTLPARPRIAVFRALQLGDMLCSVPALAALRAALPAAHVTLIGLPWARRFAERFGVLIDDFLAFPGAPGFPEQTDSSPQTRAAFFAAARTRRFDLAIQMHGSGERSSAIVTMLGARHDAGFCIRPPQTDVRHFMRWPDTLPEAERLTELIHFLGAPPLCRHVPFPLHAGDYSECSGLFARNGIDPERLICVHPGARFESRRWPAARFAMVADALAAEHWQIALTGTAAEALLTAAVRLKSACRPLDLTGATSLGGLAVLLKCARLLICNDTGVSHLAAAVGARSVVIACGSDARRWAPQDRSLHRTLAAYPRCRPCMHEICPIAHPCATAITPRQVIDAARLQLGASAGRRAKAA